MSESDLMRSLRIAASRLGARLFRQNVGQAWVGKVERGNGRVIKLGPGDLVLRNARPFHSGHEGMSDLGGWMPVSITPDMVGTTVAIYTQVEVKENARATAAQIAWIAAVENAGGFAGIAHNETELAKILRL